VEFVRYIMVGKTAKQALASLDVWRGWLAAVRRHT
jgi:hypothetical protein